jgi:single-strand DNA-binding protein
MATRSLNKVLLIGNLVRDPELRYTPQNTAVANFTVATNRTWTNNDGSEQESTEFTRCVAWGKLAEIVDQILKKGRKVYVEGRLQTREWEDQEGKTQRRTEVVADQVIALDSRSASREGSQEDGDYSYPDQSQSESGELRVDDEVKGEGNAKIDELAEDIPF